jgi:hypothetical protein
VRLRPKANRQLRVSDSMVGINEWFRSSNSKSKVSAASKTAEQEEERYLPSNTRISMARQWCLERDATYLACLGCVFRLWRDR